MKLPKYFINLHQKYAKYSKTSEAPFTSELLLIFTPLIDAVDNVASRIKSNPISENKIDSYEYDKSS